jgi:hypothetical protein
VYGLCHRSAVPLPARKDFFVPSWTARTNSSRLLFLKRNQGFFPKASLRKEHTQSFFNQKFQITMNYHTISCD